LWHNEVDPGSVFPERTIGDMTRELKKAVTPSESNLLEETVAINSLVENPRNPQQHPEDQIVRLAASLTARGQYKPLLARRVNRMLIAGHGVRLAMLKLGWTTARVVFWDIDQGTADRVMLGDNRLGEGSTPDEDRVAELLREIPNTDWLSVGFNEDEAAKLLRSFGDTELLVREIPTSTILDTFWISVRGPLAQQADVLACMKQLMADRPQVTIELGLTTDV
jgi:hypothetical protein